MENNIIEVEYTDMPENPQTEGNVPIPFEASLPTAILKNIADVFNNVTNSIKEYSMFKEQEKTKRAEIKMQLKIGLEQIQAQKEIFLTYLNNNYEKDVTMIRAFNEQVNSGMNNYTNAINGAIESAKETNDFSVVVDLLKLMNSAQATNMELMITMMDKTSGIPRFGDAPKAFGYLE